jgi:hypothetical protein
MSPPPVRIRIGASVDASLDQSLRTAVQKIGQAEKTAQKLKRETTKAAESEAIRELKAQEKLVKATEALDRQRSRGLFQQYRQQEAGAERAAKAQERAVVRAHTAERREIEKTARAAARALADEQKKRDAAARSANRLAVRQGETFAQRTSHRATRFLSGNSPLLPMAGRALGGVAQGAGIDFSVAGAVGRVTDLEAQATDLSNSGYQAGNPGANGKRVAAQDLVNQARSVGGQFGMDASDVLGGLAQYQKIAGDLDTGRQSLFQMAALAKATGTSLTDMAAATANVSNGLGDIPNKGKIIDEVMRTIAGQGKLGAVEISDMATQMARVAAAAGNFSGDQAANIQTMGALMQIARAEGGAPSAAEAARSVGGFANTFKKGKRADAFQAETGVSAFADAGKTTLKDPMTLIKTALLKTKGDLEKMNHIFMDVVGARTIGGLQKTFVGAGGGQAGLTAVDAQVARMRAAQMSKKEVEDSAAAAGGTTAAKAARFQNQLDQVTEGVMAKLVPALDQSKEGILRFAEVIGRVATWAITNPKLAIGGAIAASIARAGLESTLRAGIERLLVGPGNSRAAGLGALAGKVGGALTIASLAVTTLTVGMAIIDNWFTQAQRNQSAAVEAGVNATNASNAAGAMAQSGDLSGAIAKQKEAVAAKESELSQTQAQKPGFFGKMIDWQISNMGMQGPVDALRARDTAIERATQQQIRELTEARAHLARLVELAEAQAADGGGAPPGGRVPQ